MTSVAWIHDTKPGLGGAELATKALEDNSPEGTTFHRFDPLYGPTRTHPDDVFVLHNITEFKPQLIPYLQMAQSSGKKVIKYVHDLWPHGDPTLRDWILEEADELIFTSPLHLETFQESVNQDLRRAKIIPPPIALQQCKDAAVEIPPPAREKDILFLGRLFEGKGVFNMIRWSKENNTKIDVYGSGPDIRFIEANPDCFDYKGQADPELVPYLLSEYKRFLFIPDWIEPCGRSVLEAHAAGCEMILNDKVGATHYFDKPELIENAAADFWELVCG